MTGALTGNAMWQRDAYSMIPRRAVVAGIKTKIGNHTFRANGITAYLKNKGTLETAQQSDNLRGTPIMNGRRIEVLAASWVCSCPDGPRIVRGKEREE